MTKLPHSIVELQMFMVKSQLSWLHTLHSFFHCLLVLFHGKIPTYRSRLRGKPTVKCALRGKGPRICWQQETPPCTNGESAQFGDEPSFFTPWQIFLAIQGDFDGIACENQCCWDQFSQRVGPLEVRPELPRYHLVLTISINHICHAQKLDWII